MDRLTVYTKTAKGLMEVTGKTSFLSRDMRALLKEIDGKASVGDIQVLMSRVPEAKLREALQALLKNDFIREFKPPPPPPQQPAAEVDLDLDFTQVLPNLAAIAKQAKEDAKRQADADALAQAKAKAEAEARAKHEAQEHARRAAEEKARKDALEQARLEGERKAREAVEQARREAEEKGRIEAEELRKKLEAERRAREEAERLARAENARRLQEEAQRKAREEAERLHREAEEKARREAEELRIKLEEERKARVAAERRAREEAERTRGEAEEQMRREAEELRLRLDEERKAREEAQRRAQEEAERRAREDAERQAREAAEREQRESEEKARREAEELRLKLEEERVVAERRARLEAEDKARREAEELRLRLEAERIEAERRARLEAEEEAKRVAEELRLKLEEERRVREEAERKAKEETERLAREMSERQMREEEERKARAAEDQERREEQERARREAEELRLKLEAERRAREEGERREREAAERRAKQEGERQAREAAERTQREADEAARREAEAQARREAEARAKAKEHAFIVAGTRARQEAEEKARRESAELRARLDAESRARADAEVRAQEAARRQALAEFGTDFDALAKVDGSQLQASAGALKLPADGNAGEAAARQDQTGEDAWAREHAAAQALLQAQNAETERHFAEMEKELEAELSVSGKQAPASGEGKKAQAGRDQQAHAGEEEAAAPEPVSGRRRMRWGRPVALVLFLILVLGLVAVHFIPMDAFIPQFEKAASSALRAPVKIKSIHLALVPQPHWRLEGVSVGSGGELTVPRVKAIAEIGSMFGEAKVFKSIELESPVVGEDGMLALLFGKPAGEDLKVAQVVARNGTLYSTTFILPALDANISMGGERGWQQIALQTPDRKTSVLLKPLREGVDMEVETHAFSLPLDTAFILEDFKAKGVIRRDGLSISAFQGRIGGGVLTGNADLKRAADWSLVGEIAARSMEPAALAPALLEEGKLEGKASYAMRAKSYDELFAAPRVEGSFSIAKGTLIGVDLARLLQGGGFGGKTAFAQLSGSFVREAGKTQLNQLLLTAGPVSASGSASVDATRHLAGRINVEIKSSVARASASFAVAGTLQEPRFSR